MSYVKGEKTARNTFLSVRNLTVHFSTRRGVAEVLDGVSLDMYKGESFGLVGETGCGKSMTAFSILNLIPYPGKILSGEVWFNGEDLLRKSDTEIRKVRGAGISMVFQDPMTYLNPVFTIGDLLTSVILLHLKDTSKKHNRNRLSRGVLRQLATNKAVDALRLVRMPDTEKILRQYPHELSAGMRQRVMIAMMLSCNPELLIADEATTNLDVTIQAQILQLLGDLKNSVGCSLLIITHDLGIVAEMCERVAVMYAGNIVEIAKVKDFFHNPKHPYTEGLLKCIPKISSDVEKLEVIQGNVPDLINPPLGCRFNPRCPLARNVCRKEKPKLIEVEPDHFIACHH